MQKPRHYLVVVLICALLTAVLLSCSESESRSRSIVVLAKDTEALDLTEFSEIPVQSAAITDSMIIRAKKYFTEHLPSLPKPKGKYAIVLRESKAVNYNESDINYGFMWAASLILPGGEFDVISACCDGRPDFLADALIDPGDLIDYKDDGRDNDINPNNDEIRVITKNAIKM